MRPVLLLAAIYCLVGCGRTEVESSQANGAARDPIPVARPFPLTSVQALQGNPAAWSGMYVRAYGYILYGEVTKIWLVSQESDVKNYRVDQGVHLTGYAIRPYEANDDDDLSRLGLAGVVLPREEGVRVPLVEVEGLVKVDARRDQATDRVIERPYIVIVSTRVVDRGK